MTQISENSRTQKHIAPERLSARKLSRKFRLLYFMAVTWNQCKALFSSRKYLRTLPVTISNHVLSLQRKVVSHVCITRNTYFLHGMFSVSHLFMFNQHLVKKLVIFIDNLLATSHPEEKHGESKFAYWIRDHAHISLHF